MLKQIDWFIFSQNQMEGLEMKSWPFGFSHVFLREKHQKYVHLWCVITID